MTGADLETRVISLETKLAHHERTIEDLNQLVFDQAKTIDRLTRDLEQVVQHLRDMMEAQGKE